MDFYGLKHKRNQRRADSDIQTVMLAVIVVAVLTIGAGLAGVGPLGPYIKQNIQGGGGGGGGASTGTCAPPYVAPTGFVCTSLPIQYYVFDPLVPAGTASGISSAQVSVIDLTTTASKEVPSTTASTGLVTGAVPFTSGNSYSCKIVTTNYVTEFLPCFVPPISSSSSAQLSSITMPLPEVKTNTWSWSASGAGTTWGASFSTANFAVSGLSSVTMTFTITANNNNQGYYSSYNLVKKIQYLMIFEIYSPSSPTTTVTGCQFSYTLNNVARCQFIMPDGFTTINPSYSQGSSAITGNFPLSTDSRYTTANPKSQTITVGTVQTAGSLSQQLIGTTQYGGSVQFPVTFNLASLAAGSNEVWTAKMWLYADVLFYDGGGGYAAQGTYGGDQSQATLTGGNSPTITLKN